MYIWLYLEPSADVACPLQSSYQFIYNNNSDGFCRQPVSFIQKCAAESKLYFHFKRCPAYAYLQEETGMCHVYGYV